MPTQRLSRPEFIAMCALIISMVAYATDAMLPAFSDIAAELTPDAPERTALMVSFFMMGMGLGTFVTGPLSDAYGRKRVIVTGMVLYVCGALVSWTAPSYTMLLMGRALQGFGAAAPRVVAPAMVRDLFEGRKMAQVTSLIMTVFLLVPAAAPSIGQVLLWVFGWRAIFGSFVVIALIAGLWLHLRQPETLPPERRRPFTAPQIWRGLVEIAGRRRVLIFTAALTLGFCQMVTLISTVEPIYDHSFDQRKYFPLWFMATALIASTGAMVNASLVMRIGMQRMVRSAFLVQAGLAITYLLLLKSGALGPVASLVVFFLWSSQLVFMAGLIFGNLNALALQPLGHMAGLGASVITALSTIGAAIIAGLVGLATAGSPGPLVLLSALAASTAYILMSAVDVLAPDEGQAA